MLNEHIKKMAAQEEGFPGFQQVFDLDKVKSFLPATAKDIKAYYVRYKVGTSCLVQYSYRLDKDVKYAYLKAYSTKDKPKHLTEKEMEFYAFPEDGVLTQIKNVFDIKSAPYFFHSVDPMHEDFYLWEKSVLSYRPEKRLVLKLGKRDDAIVLKIFSKSSYLQAVNNNNILVSNNHFQCPALIAENKEFQVITNEWIPGESMFTHIGNSANILQDSELVAKGLANFHSQAKVGLKPYHISSILQDIENIQRELIAIFPEMQSRFERLCGNISYLVERVAQINAPCHGDFDANQIIIGKDNISFIDFDRACNGHPALDVGNYLAKLTAWHIFGFIDEENKALLHNTFLSSYRNEFDMDERDIENYYLFCLLKCSTEPFRRQYENWPDIIDAVIGKIESQIHINANKQQSKPEPLKRYKEKQSIKYENLAADRNLNYLLDLLDADVASEELSSISKDSQVRVNTIRIIKHRENKRCLLEFNSIITFSDGFIENTSIMGKSRAKGLDKKIFRLQEELWNNGFDDNSEDMISIPKPCGMIEEYNIWLYKKIDGRSFASQLDDDNIREKVKNIANICYKLQKSNAKAWKDHTIKSELMILKKGFARLIEINKSLTDSVNKLYSLCETIANRLPEIKLPIHRDYYPHQVVVSENRYFVIDMDLFAYGDPCLDIGNFNAHLKEQALREKGDIDAYIELEKIIENSYCQLDKSTDCLQRVTIYTWLAMARHVFLSAKYPERQGNVEYLVDLCLSRIRKII